MHTEKAILNRFSVTEVPHIIMLRGVDGQAHEVYAGRSLTMTSLREWLLDQVQANVRDPGEEGVFEAIEGAGFFDATEMAMVEDDPEEDGQEESASASEASASASKATAGKKPGPSPS